MAKEYIERGAVVKELQEELDYESLMYTKEQNKHIDIGLGIALRTVKRLPAADVVEVKHGYWTIETEEHRDSVSGEIDEEFYLKCSECGREVWGIDHMTVLHGTDEEIFGDYPYCHCGAKMDGKENNE